jgi:hypothetical protein
MHNDYRELSLYIHVLYFGLSFYLYLLTDESRMLSLSIAAAVTHP